MLSDGLLLRLLDVGGIAVVSVLLVWRIDVRLASVEKAMNKLASEIHSLVWKLKE